MSGRLPLSVRLRLAVKAGNEGRLFGAVKTVDVAEAVKAAGLGDLDKRKIHITAPIKSVGEHEATIRLRDDLTAVMASANSGPAGNASATVPR